MKAEFKFFFNHENLETVFLSHLFCFHKRTIHSKLRSQLLSLFNSKSYSLSTPFHLLLACLRNALAWPLPARLPLPHRGLVSRFDRDLVLAGVYATYTI